MRGLKLFVEVAIDLSNRGRHYENRLHRLVEAMQTYLRQEERSHATRTRKVTVSTSRRLSKRITDDQLSSIVSKYREGASSADLAAYYGASKTSIVELLRRSNIDIRDRRITPENQELAINLYAEGKSLAAVGKRIKVSPSSVRNLLVRKGIPRRS